MTTFSYALLLASTVLAAGLLDAAWLRYVRPIMTRRFGWRAVEPGEQIPLTACAAGSAFILVFILLLDLGAAVGY